MPEQEKKDYYHKRVKEYLEDANNKIQNLPPDDPYRDILLTLTDNITDAIVLLLAELEQKIKR